MKLPLNIDIQQILLHMLNFVILFGGLYFILYSPVKKFIDERKKSYENMDIEAKEALEKAKNAQKQYDEKMSSVNYEIEKMKQISQEEAGVEAKKLIEKAEKEAKDIVDKARKTIEFEKQESIKDANREISDLAVSAARKIVFESTSESYDAFLDSAKEDENGGN